jgi:hypothetical protein
MAPQDEPVLEVDEKVLTERRDRLDPQPVQTPKPE